MSQECHNEGHPTTNSQQVGCKEIDMGVTTTGQVGGWSEL